MPGRNIEKFYVPDNYYHVYNRGLGKMDIFCDPADFSVFLNLLKRNLGSEIVKNKKSGYVYSNFSKDLDLLAYCLMPNHYHMLLKTKDKPKQLAELMRSVITAYSMYFNKKYGRSGPLFGSRYRAVRITDNAQLQHISRYIHLNPLDVGSDYFSYKYSSLQFYLGNKQAEWLEVDEMMELFNGKPAEYLKFLKDYRAHKEELAKIKKYLF